MRRHHPCKRLLPFKNQDIKKSLVVGNKQTLITKFSSTKMHFSCTMICFYPGVSLLFGFHEYIHRLVFGSMAWSAVCFSWIANWGGTQQRNLIAFIEATFSFQFGKHFIIADSSPLESDSLWLLRSSKRTLDSISVLSEGIHFGNDGIAEFGDIVPLRWAARKIFIQNWPLSIVKSSCDRCY